VSRILVHRILTNKRSLILSYDQGLEHGPSIFNLDTVKPTTVLDLALEGSYNGIVLHHGLAEKYYGKEYTDVPLIVKLNGKSSLTKINPISRLVCSVNHAAKIGASAVGYTIYDGSPAEPEMFAEFQQVVEQAHDYGMPVIAWMYPRGPDIQDELRTDVLAYSARIALELGADFVKLKYNKDPPGFKWVTECAGRTKVLVADMDPINDAQFLQNVADVMHAGAAGLAVGRNIWQHPSPLKLTRAVRKIIFQGASPQDALKELE
jgi:fructose-bisphosphate aldolase, class I